MLDRIEYFGPDFKKIEPEFAYVDTPEGSKSIQNLAPLHFEPDFEHCEPDFENCGPGFE